MSYLIRVAPGLTEGVRPVLVGSPVQRRWPVDAVQHPPALTTEDAALSVWDQDVHIMGRTYASAYTARTRWNVPANYRGLHRPQGAHTPSLSGHHKRTSR